MDSGSFQSYKKMLINDVSCMQGKRSLPITPEWPTEYKNGESNVAGSCTSILYRCCGPSCRGEEVDMTCVSHTSLRETIFSDFDGLVVPLNLHSERYEILKKGGFVERNNR